jgi:hypothetical protein
VVPALSPTQQSSIISWYWSATTSAGDPNDAWLVSFVNEFGVFDFKDDALYVRAVRSGL